MACHVLSSPVMSLISCVMSGLVTSSRVVFCRVMSCYVSGHVPSCRFFDVIFHVSRGVTVCLVIQSRLTRPFRIFLLFFLLFFFFDKVFDKVFDLWGFASVAGRFYKRRLDAEVAGRAFDEVPPTEAQATVLSLILRSFRSFKSLVPSRIYSEF